MGELDAVVVVSPYALTSRATRPGTATFADAGILTPAVLVTIVAASAVLSVLIVVLNTVALERSGAGT